MIVGTAGHVDHGKTSLVRALTGIDTDRLPEEKARGISIELGFAYASLAEESGDPGLRANGARDDAPEPIGFIDVPGHSKFVQTMIAGAAGIDLGLLVVAADDGPMPQTREHLDILAWLGVRELVVALSKVDAVDDERRREASREVRAMIDASIYSRATIVPVSTVSREGIAALTATLRAYSRKTAGAHTPLLADASHQVGRHFRLAIDRAFVLQGIGLVVTGTCFAGHVAIDNMLTLLPSGLEARVRGIHAQNRSVEEARAGQRVALNLVGRGIEKSTVHRGDWVVASTIAIQTERVDVLLVANETPSADDGAFAWLVERNWRRVRFHSGAASVNARVVLLDANQLNDLHDRTRRLAQIVFDKPLHLIAGDRFVLRDASGSDRRESGHGASIAGGIVIDVDVPARGRRAEARLAFLHAAAQPDVKAALEHAVRTGDKGVDLARWNVTHNTALEVDAIETHAVRGTSAGAEPSMAMTLFSHARWDALLARVVDVLATEHARAPDAVGPGRDRLRRMAMPSFNAAIFTALVDTLKASSRVSQTGPWLHLPAHRVALSALDRGRFDRARALIEKAGEPNNPPRVRDIARELNEDESAIRTLCARLASLGEMYKVAHDHYYLPVTVHALARVVAELQQSDGVTRAATFRDRIGVGRKIAVLILEFFDRVGYTRRLGDEHRIIQPGLFDS